MQLVLDIASTSGSERTDEVVSVLADDIIDLALEQHSGKEGRGDISLHQCLAASQQHAVRSSAEAGSGVQHPFFDSFAQRAVMHDGIARTARLSAMSIALGEGRQGHVERHAVTLHSGEEMVLTFQTAGQATVSAAYKGLRSQNVWVLTRVAGEYDEGTLQVRLCHKPYLCVARPACCSDALY